MRCEKAFIPRRSSQFSKLEIEVRVIVIARRIRRVWLVKLVRSGHASYGQRSRWLTRFLRVASDGENRARIKLARVSTDDGQIIWVQVDGVAGKHVTGRRETEGKGICIYPKMWLDARMAVLRSWNLVQPSIFHCHASMTDGCHRLTSCFVVASSCSSRSCCTGNAVRRH